LQARRESFRRCWIFEFAVQQQAFAEGIGAERNQEK
jgi:hypothetical protein